MCKTAEAQRPISESRQRNRNLRRAAVAAGVLALHLLMPPAAAWARAPYRVYRHDETDAAIRAAQIACKPLAIHVIPTVERGSAQIDQYYGRQSPIPRHLLDRFVVLVIPKDSHSRLAADLNITEAGGIRVVSPYDLTPVDGWGITTTIEGIEWRQHDGSAGQRYQRRTAPERMPSASSVNESEATAEPANSPNVETPPAGGLEVPPAFATSPPRPDPCGGCGFQWGDGIIPSQLELVAHHEELPPREARAYFHESSRRFEFHAAQEFPKILREPRAGSSALLAALGFVATRRPEVDQQLLEEILVIRRSGPDGALVQARCVDAMVAATRGRAATARFLAYVGSRFDPPADRRTCIGGLKRLNPEATVEMLAYLERSPDRFHRRRLATMLRGVCGVDSPVRLRDWETMDQEAAQAAIDDWRARIAERDAAEAARRAADP